MLFPSLNDLLENIDNRYLLVNVIAKRARDIADEERETMEPLMEKAVKIAIGEIADSRLTGRLKKGVVSSAEF